MPVSLEKIVSECHRWSLAVGPYDDKAAILSAATSGSNWSQNLHWPDPPRRRGSRPSR